MSDLMEIEVGAESNVFGLDAGGDPASARPEVGADMDDESREPIQLLDLPNEVLRSILLSLQSLKALDCCARASPLLGSCLTLAEAFVKWYEPDFVPRLVATGAPVAVVRHVLGAWKLRARWPFLRSAALGNCVETIQWLCDHVDPAGTGHSMSGALDPQFTALEVDCVNVADALSGVFDAAISEGCVDAFCWLVGNVKWTTFRDSGAFIESIARKLVVAKKDGHSAQRLDMFAHMHRDARYRDWAEHKGKNCLCPAKLGSRAVHEDRADVAEWMYIHRCESRYEPNQHCLQKAIKRGWPRVVHWAAHVLAEPDADGTLVFPRLGAPLLIKAISKGHVAAAVTAHQLGVVRCTPYVIASTIGSPSALDMVQWVAGERILDSDYTLVEGEGTLLEDCWGPWLAVIAIVDARSRVLDWLYERPDAARIFTASAARKAVRIGHLEAALRIHQMGWASFSTWNALSAALDTKKLQTVQAVATNGALCDAHLLSVAIRTCPTSIVEFLCEHYGLGYLQEAVDNVGGYKIDLDTLGWIRRNAPHVCLREATISLFTAEAQLADTWPHACECPACHPRAPSFS